MPTEPATARTEVAAAFPQRGKIFYGWWIVAAGVVAIAVNSSVYFYGMAVFFTPLIQEFGWSRTALAGAFSIARMQAGIAGPLTGAAIDRWGPRRMMMIGMVMVAAGFGLLGRVTSLEAFYAIFIIFLSIGSGLSASPPVGAAIANWFSRRRGLAMGLLMCGGGVGGFIAAGLGFLINAYGWRTTMDIIAVAILVTGLPAAAVIRHRPEPYGWLPDGAPPDPSQRKPAAGASTPRVEADRSFRPREAIATSAFWVLSTMFALRNLTTSGALVHLPALMVDRGHPLEVAATIAGLVALFSIIGRFACGWLADRVDERYLVAATFAFASLSLEVLALGTTPLHVATFVVGYGISYGGSVPLTMSMVARYFGHRWFGTVYGLSQFVIIWGSVGGPLLAGYGYDTTGSYETAIHIFAVANIVGLALAFMVRRPSRPALRPALS